MPNSKFQIPNLKQKGFSVMEAIVYVAIAAVVVLIITQIFISQSQVYDKETASADIELAAKNALNRLVQNSIAALGVSASHTFDGTTYTSSSSTLVLQLQSIDSNQNLLSNKYDYVVFYLDATSSTFLYMKIDADAASSRKTTTALLASFVETVNFRYNQANLIDATKVDISLNLAKIVRSQKRTAQSSTAIFFKNKF